MENQIQRKNVEPQLYDIPDVYKDDEINIAAIVSVLIRRKLIFIGGMLAFICGGILYLLISEPSYTVVAHVVKPYQSEIGGLNLGRFGSTVISTYNPEQVFEYFEKQLLSDQALQRFFNEVLLPHLEKSEQQIPANGLYEQVRKILQISGPDEKVGGRRLYVVSVKTNDPQRSYRWLKKFLDQVSSDAVNKLIKDDRSVIDLHIADIELKLKELRHIYAMKRQDRLKILIEALYVAESVNLIEPKASSAQFFKNDEAIVVTDESTLYLRGTKALKAEIDVLKNRKSDDPFIPNFRDIESRLKLFRAISLNPDTFSVFSNDREINVPELPDRPDTMKIITLSVLLGAIFGLILAFLTEYICLIGNKSTTNAA